MPTAAKRTLMSWSSGKDSAWCLHRLLQDDRHRVEGLFCSVNADAQRVSMHAVRLELLNMQAERLGLPLHVIRIPQPCPNKVYERAMGEFVARVKADGVEQVAFGDLFVEDIRRYRINHLKDTGIEPVFPLWGIPTKRLAREIVDGGLRAILSCVNSRQLDAKFIGREFDHALLDELPDDVDPCGENGEFHTFVYDAPPFSSPIAVRRGEKLMRDGFQFIDLLPD